MPANKLATVAPPGDGMSSSTATSAAPPEATGASFTAVTVMPTLSLSLRAPPVPLLPRSLVVIASDAAPLKSAVGANTSPFSAVLIALAVPVKVIVALPLAPPVIVRPTVPASVSVPLVTVSVTCNGLPPASASATLMALPFAVLNASVASSFTVCAAGTPFTGGWFATSVLVSATSAGSSPL